MRSIRRSLGTAGYAALTECALVLVSSWLTNVEAQERHRDHGREPLVLKEQGMFYVGGDIVHTDAANGPNGPTLFDKSGDIAINQMYVGFMRPQNERGLPIILMHGGNLSGAC